MAAHSADFLIHRATLPSGLRLRVVPLSGTGTATLLVCVGTGSRYEAASEAGISHFLEHIFFKGSKKRPTTRMISETIDRVGGEFNAFTSKEVTVFWAKAAVKHVALILDVIGDMLLHPLFDPKEIDRERGVITEEINMYEDTPRESIDEFAEELLYGRHPLGRQIIGTKEIVARLKRRAFTRYVAQQYRGRNAVVCLAGNVSAEQGEKLLSDVFRGWPKGAPRRPAPFRGRWGRSRFALKEKQTDQAHVMAATPGVSYTHRDRSAVDLLCAILGGSMSSRLFMEVRERRGLAYAIRTVPQHFTDTGHIATQAGVDPQKLPEAVRVILAEYERLRAKGVPPAELLKAKENLKGRLLLKLESSDDVAQFVAGQEVLTNRILSVDEVFQRLEAVTLQDIRRVARVYLKPASLRIAAIAPGGSAAGLKEAL